MSTGLGASLLSSDDDEVVVVSARARLPRDCDELSGDRFAAGLVSGLGGDRGDVTVDPLFVDAVSIC